MPPREPYRYGPPGQPGQPQPMGQQPMYPPQQPVQPQAPGQYGYPGYGQAPQQMLHLNQNGQYDVLPAPQAAPNNGHSGHNPYEFIVNPNTPKHTPFSFNLAGGNVGMKLGMLIGGVVVLMIVVALAISAFSPKGNKAGMESIAERQQEMIRLTSNAIQQQQDQSADAQYFVANVQASMESSQLQITNYLAKNGTKLSSKTLGLDKNTGTDATLAQAASAGTFDDTMAQVLVAQLKNYQGLLQTTFNQTNSISGKQLLQQNYNAAALLIKQGTALEQELQS